MSEEAAPLSSIRAAARMSARAQVAFAAQLAAARESCGLSQAELASRLGVDTAAIATMERADSDPRLSQLRHYLSACGAALQISVLSPAQTELPTH